MLTVSYDLKHWPALRGMAPSLLYPLKIVLKITDMPIHQTCFFPLSQQTYSIQKPVGLFVFLKTSKTIQYANH